ncbi:MAG: hypothetical protein HXX09_16005 [Bacteroidetes bacterium]|nr:hypothetical protein [Bacteroidota bacterium]
MLINTSKAFILLLGVCLIIISFFTFFPFINSVFTNFNGFGKIARDNFSLIIPVVICIIPFSLILGYASKIIFKKRLLKLAIIGLARYFITFFVAMLFISSLNISMADLFPMLLLGIYMSVTFAFWVYPLIFFSIFILNRWTKRI